MLILICIVLIIWSLDVLCYEKDREEERDYDYKVAERRHREILASQREQERYIKRATERLNKEVLTESKAKRKTTRRIARDKDGIMLGEEITEEF